MSRALPTVRCLILCMAACFGAFSIVLGTIIGQLYDNNLVPIVSGFLMLGVFALFAMNYAEKKRKQLGITSDGQATAPSSH